MSPLSDLQRSIEDALRELERVPRAPWDAAFAAMVVEPIGDALRLELPVPTALLEWIEGWTARELDEVATLIRAGLDRARVPPSFEDDLDLAALADVVRRRDLAESARLALQRASLGRTRRIPLTALPELRGLAEQLHVLDELLAKTAAPELLDAVLEDRRPLSLGRPWPSHLHAPAPSTQAELRDTSTLDLGALGPAPAELGPPDEVVANYVARGSHRSWVEGFAALESTGELARRLLETIDAFLDPAIDEPVSLVARAWASRVRAPRVAGSSSGRRASATTTASCRLAVLAPQRRAASPSSGLEPRAPRELDLGRLSPADAHAQLTVGEDHLELRVASETGLTTLRLGDHEATAQPHGIWAITVGVTEAPMLLVAEDAAGDRFEATLVFEVAPEPDAP